MFTFQRKITIPQKLGLTPLLLTVNPCVNPLYQALYGVYKQKNSTVKG